MSRCSKICIAAALAAAVLAGGAAAAAWWMYGKVRAFEREHGGDVFACLSRSQLDERAKKALEEVRRTGQAADAPAPAQSAHGAAQPPPEMRVLETEYGGDDSVSLVLSSMPDMEAVRRYVTVSPLNEGTVSCYARRISGGRCRLTVSGDFAFGTNVTLRVHKGLPSAVPDEAGRSGAARSAAGLPERAQVALEEDFTFGFERNDRRPLLDFADSGRYLPPAGARAVALRSVNLAGVEARVRQVPAANIVQMLAVEEDAYDHIRRSWWDGDSDEFVEDLAGEPRKVELGIGGEANRETEASLALGGGNGIYFVQLSGRARDDVRWTGRGDSAEPIRVAGGCRVVCVTDLGLSVRESGDSLLVWVNSLSTGAPVAGAFVEAYSQANVLVARGVTDGTGLCRAAKVAEGTPFAVAAGIDGDCSFIALRPSMEVDETFPGGARDPYLKDREISAFVWTERGIYRHDEPIFLHAILRDASGSAPAPCPLTARLVNPSGDLHSSAMLAADGAGSIVHEGFSVPADQPSGMWTVELRTPGDASGGGRLLGSRKIKVEEFAPPQIRVKVEAAQECAPRDFSFSVCAEHLYGGAARNLACEGAVVFEDAPFAPEGWSGFRFGNDDLGLKPSFRRLGKSRLDDAGAASFQAPLWAESGRPRAAVRATAQGTVFEDGGRPATARASATLHAYPHYIGATLPSWLRRPEIGLPQIEVACVRPDGGRVDRAVRLVAKVERIESVYAYRRNAQGWATWDCEYVRTPVAEGIQFESFPDRDAVLSLPVRECGDYALTIADLDSDASFGATFYLSDWGDEAVRAPLSDPTAVSVSPDKPFYRVGDVPRMVVKSPFAGSALLAVMRDGVELVEAFALTNATSEITLPPVTEAWAPSVDVCISVVQSAAGPAASARRGAFAVRAHGETCIEVRPVEREIPVELDAAVDLSGEGGATVGVSVKAWNVPEEGAAAVVTLVDEGINLLTDEPVPDPIGFFAAPRTAGHPLYDLYHRLLPVLGEDSLRASGVKTGGGFGAEMLSRVSPVPSRRFKPLAMWQTEVPLARSAGEDGAALGSAVFRLPEFVGEIRVTAVVHTRGATGAAAVSRKVAPKIVMQPDAPRFVAPGDEFDVALPVANRSGAEARIGFALVAKGPLKLVEEKKGGMMTLADGGSEVLAFRVKATGIGEGELAFSVSGAGEAHEKTLLLPVRPAVPWRETAGVDVLKPGESRVYPASNPFRRVAFTVGGSPVAELKAAFDWLAAYPHGCLEQTVSRMMPLLTLSHFAALREPSGKADVEDVVAAGVRRVESMIRSHDFVMWPDCCDAPWDREVSLYAAHFLVEAEKAGAAVSPGAKRSVLKFLRNWALSTNDTVSAYACRTLALAGESERDRMLRLYDGRDNLDALSRARLAGAFVMVSDRKRAETLLATAGACASVKEAAFSLLALLDLDPDDARVPVLVSYLLSRRDKARCSWGTTGENAHALLALGAYYARAGMAPQGEEPEVERIDNADGSVRLANAGGAQAFVSWKRIDLPEPAEMKDESTLLSISRRFLTPEGSPADLAAVARGDMLIVELKMVSSEDRDYSDLVIEDLFAGAIEPIHGQVAQIPALGGNSDWVMRSDARDDRMLVFSRKFHLGKGDEAVFRYPARVVSAGDFVLPGASVEAMYAPEIHARCAPSRLKVEK